MPNIREVNAPQDLGLRPDDRAMESTANAGRRISALYSTIAEAKMSVGRSARGAIEDVGGVAVKFAEHQEISRGAAESAKTLAGLDEKWNATIKNADPNDPTVGAKFREEVVEPTLEKLKDGFFTEGGNRFAESQVQNFRNHFVTKTTSDMARMAGVAAKTNIETLTNSLSNAAINDPTSLSAALGLVSGSISAMVDSSPNLKGADAAQLKIELTHASQAAIVKAAAIGAINANPEAGLKRFSSPEFSKYISGTELKQLEQQARTVERARRVDENYSLQNQKLFREEASDAREGEYLQKLHSSDPKERASVSASAIANDFTLTRTARERMINIVERETKPAAAAKISNDTANDLISRIRAPEGDPRRITDLNPVYEAYEKGKLNKSDLKFVRDEFVNLRTPDGEALGKQQDEFIKSVKHFMTNANPMLGKLDPSGEQKVYEFTQALSKKIAEYRKAGKDPRDLMDPSKPDYMGSPAAIAPYQKSLQQSLEDTARQMREMSGKQTSVPIPSPPVAAPSASNPPASLKGIASLSYSATRKQFRDDATGKIYDQSGNEVK